MIPKTTTLPGARLLAALFLTFAVGSAGCGGAEHAEEEAATYPVTHPKLGDTEVSREYVAQIRAIQHIEVRALEGGYLEQIFVDEGQPVKQGQRMFQIMPRVYQAELEKAKAEAEFEQIEYENTRKLAERNVVSPNELALAKAKLDQANAEVSLASVHLGLTDVKAPFDGIMGRLEVRKGSLLEEGELLTTLADNSKMWVYYNVTEAEYLDYKSQLAEGEAPRVALTMANGHRFDEEGVVETIEADFNNETGNIAFRATFPNPDGLLRHGETGKVVMTVPLHDVVMIPQKATFDVLDKRYVFLVGDDGTIARKEIQVLEELPHVYVVEGLAPEDTLLIDGLRKVRDGQHVATAYEEPDSVFAALEHLHAE